MLPAWPKRRSDVEAPAFVKIGKSYKGRLWLQPLATFFGLMMLSHKAGNLTVVWPPLVPAISVLFCRKLKAHVPVSVARSEVTKVGLCHLYAVQAGNPLKARDALDVGTAWP